MLASEPKKTSSFTANVEMDKFHDIRSVRALSDLERDALAELSNIAMAEERPAVACARYDRERGSTCSSFGRDSHRRSRDTPVAKPYNPKLVAVRQAFAARSPVEAHFFPERNSLELVRAVVGR